MEQQKFSPKETYKEDYELILLYSPRDNKKEYDEKCDILSIEIIIYIMLTRKPPFNDLEDESIFNVGNRKFVHIKVYVPLPCKNAPNELLSQEAGKTLADPL